MADLYTIDKTEHGFTGRFEAMASPCEILLDLHDRLLAEQLVHAAFSEAKRNSVVISILTLCLR